MVAITSPKGKVPSQPLYAKMSDRCYWTPTQSLVFVGNAADAIPRQTGSQARFIPIKAGDGATIGDGLQTDVLGAAAFGIDCVFVTGGIHDGEPFPHDFAERNGLGDWSPVAVVPSL